MLERDDRDGNVNWRFLFARTSPSLVVAAASPRLNEITAPPREKCGWKLWRGKERLAPRSASSFIFGTCHICMEYKPELEMEPFAAVCCTAGSHLRGGGRRVACWFSFCPSYCSYWSFAVQI